MVKTNKKTHRVMYGPVGVRVGVRRLAISVVWLPFIPHIFSRIMVVSPLAYTSLKKNLVITRVPSWPSEHISSMLEFDIYELVNISINVRV